MSERLKLKDSTVAETIGVFGADPRASEDLCYCDCCHCIKSVNDLYCYRCLQSLDDMTSKGGELLLIAL